MSSEVPLDLSNESKPDRSSKRKSVNSNVMNGNTNSKGRDRSDTKPTMSQMANTTNTTTSATAYVAEEVAHKRPKLAINSSAGSDVNPLQRGKYGLRLMPQQVDYYQSILEDRRIRMYRESSRQTLEIEPLEKELKPENTKLTIRKPKTSQSSGKYEFDIGDIVWGTLPNYKTWFPALIISHMHCKQKPAKKGQTWVYWFGDHQVSEIPKSKIKSFIHYFPEFSKGTSSLTSLRVKEALQVLASRAGLSFPLDENVATSSSTTNEDENALILWAKNGFQLKTGSNRENAFKPDQFNPIPSLAAVYLPLDSVYQEALKTDERLQQIVYYEVEKSENTETQNEIPEYKLTQIERVKNKEVTISQICIACCCDAESFIGNDSKTLLQHPLFEGGLCRLCYDNIKVTMYAPGADNKNSFCAICGQLGNLAICENDSCHRVFCLKCIDLLVGSGVHLKVLEMDKWECYICKPDVEQQTGLLKVRTNWRFNVKMLFDPLVNGLKSSHLIEESSNEKRELRVLSLFDGVASAKIALEILGFKIDKYYASESDAEAVNIAKVHHKDSIVYIDSIENITIEKIASMGPIDLVLGSSPPESSLTGSSRKSLLDSKGSGHFMLYFNHILNLLRLVNKSHHIFFLFENSNPLTNSQRDIISDLLMCKAVTLYANDFCQNRNRYYWSNIPGIKRPLPQNIQEKFISLINILTQNTTKKGTIDKSQTIHKSNIFKPNPVQEDKSFEPIELEKLFGLQENYTDLNSLTKSKRQTILTKSWCISILSHLIWSLSDFFVMTDSIQNQK